MNYIYGAGELGQIVFEILHSENVCINGFVVSSRNEMTPDEISGVKVLTVGALLDSVLDESESNFNIYVAVSEKKWGEIEDKISEIQNRFIEGNVVWLTHDDILDMKRKFIPVRAESFLNDINPVSRVFGLDRGKPIDRYYIEKFLHKHSLGIKVPQNVIEVGNDFGYGKQFFNSNKIIYSTLDYDKGMDLTDYSTLPQEQYDVFICTQVFNFIYDVKAAIKGAYYLLKKGGTLLATVAGNVSQVSSYDMERWGDYWRFTTLGIEKLIVEVFGENIKVEGYGNAMAATAFVQGIAVEDVNIELLDKVDDNYSIVIGICATKKV